MKILPFFLIFFSYIFFQTLDKSKRRVYTFVMMNKTVSLYVVSPSKRLAFAAVFAALVCTSTFAIAIPLPHGYFNLGDVFVLLSAWFCGPLYGAIAAALGSALADVIAGFALYVPATFLIKGVDALIAYTVCLFLKKVIKKERLDFLPRLFSGLAGEAFMALGYFTFESILYGTGGAAVALAGNALQGACCLTIAVTLFSLFYPIKAVRKFFPALTE